MNGFRALGLLIQLSVWIAGFLTAVRMVALSDSMKGSLAEVEEELR